MSQYNYEIGLSLGNMINLETLLGRPPRGLFTLFPTTYVGGDSGLVGDGLPAAKWQIKSISQTALNLLRAYLYQEATTNLCTNPSFETNAAGWVAIGGAIARSPAQFARGVASLAVTPTSGMGDGAQYPAGTLLASTAYAMALDWRGVLNIPYLMYMTNGGGNHMSPITSVVGTGAWQRATVVWTNVAAEAMYLMCLKNNHASTGAFYLDGAQLEAKAYATAYCDGSLKGCVWTGTAHASTSQRLYSTYLMSAPVYIRTRKDDGTFAYFSAIMNWPKDVMASKVEMSKYYQDVEIEFTGLVQQ